MNNKSDRVPDAYDELQYVKDLITDVLGVDLDEAKKLRIHDLMVAMKMEELEERISNLEEKRTRRTTGL